ncbi:hypothetical protein AXG93_1217s1320 [Marchantia polymorpha subsp. ruderalis]|uniref:Uncharacterized protein n=1 Tax=Marchantia polymorpha subsp. ruderalis TaxID=1480154 RepID=A0A176VSY4_MARPO|nr:hypothetical protein AXG93_1217s1320 [Marchantia polymorpha subsp. ruderalis]
MLTTIEQLLKSRKDDSSSVLHEETSTRPASLLGRMDGRAGDQICPQGARVLPKSNIEQPCEDSRSKRRGAPQRRRRETWSRIRVREFGHSGATRSLQVAAGACVVARNSKEQTDTGPRKEGAGGGGQGGGAGGAGGAGNGRWVKEGWRKSHEGEQGPDRGSSTSSRAEQMPSKCVYSLTQREKYMYATNAFATSAARPSHALAAPRRRPESRGAGNPNYPVPSRRGLPNGQAGDGPRPKNEQLVLCERGWHKSRDRIVFAIANAAIEPDYETKANDSVPWLPREIEGCARWCSYVVNVDSSSILESD